MRKLEIVLGDERLITPSGLSLAGQVLGTSMDTQILDGNISMFQECRVEPSALKNGSFFLTKIVLK